MIRRVALLALLAGAADGFSPTASPLLIRHSAASPQHHRPSLRNTTPSYRQRRVACSPLMQQKTDSAAASKADKTTSEVDLCNIEGSFCEPEEVAGGGGFSYGSFARDYPFANNILIATAKSGAADLLAQTVLQGTPLDSVDWTRSLLFCTFGAIYLGGFQYLYQVQIFKRLFDVDKFTSQPWADKVKDGPGLRALAAQTALDLTVLTLIYLPTFYVFKAGVFTGSSDPSVWLSSGLESYTTNFAKDELDLIRVWLPADVVCFSVPLYLRLPVRHIVSFVWTAYLSFARGGH
mmetsp:Transcript_36229/g.70821  ORF Transcript_36229/g.70821 Transcript_36229/m.70821 type:complete len:292 (-) Transcript_36229:157-1032(-)|eukprot:CAMPEP_0173391890 /NCGR_PEP_ID=MMETSP1356-20130122/18643_1 /TAXON_ID=77927 ORGANISM="Hemiselmis virescens, Strain PCC157" /NCGR_SAMPLE_ID=MMETSP1356 /ASSEMBLY_ACC=CAM_ASM_000847 /LENGTH=291 /DNA_ID=CAMNT_0014349585 /DNA_START=96 /DNA_END=971 /DNA_ORIENTATION=+